MPKQKTNWILDAVLFIGFLMTFFLDWTGLSWHQWLGVFLGTLAFYHLLIHWKWVAAVTRRFTGNTSRQSRVYYLLDWSILLTFLVIGISGLVVSTWLNLDLGNYLLWKDLHVYSSIASLVLILIKIAVHWRWVVKTARNYFGLWKTPVPVGAAVATTGRTNNGSLNRREFLQLMGFAGLASLLSAANLVDFSQAAGQSILEDQTTPPQLPDTYLENSSDSVTSCQVICDGGCTYPGKCRRYIDRNGNGICDLTECSTQDTSSQANEGSVTIQEAENPSIPEMESSTLAEVQETGECVVLCPKGCAYPGQCNDYIDLNGNGLCDYGECLESSAEQEVLTSSHTGGGGRQRRGKH
jgi:hypothetical protein